MSKLRLFFLIMLIAATHFQCNTDNPVPEVYVNRKIQLNNSVYLPLNSIGNSVFISDEGNKGIIVTRIDLDKFAAYDATCTYDPEHEYGRVAIKNPNDLVATDTVCGSKFILMLDGLPQDGSLAGLPLKQYVADYYPNSNELIIHN